MNTLTYEIDGTRTDIQMPATIAECNGAQLTAVAAACLDRLTEDDALRQMGGIPAEVVEALSPFQRFKIVEALEPLFSFSAKDLVFKEWKFPEIVIDGETFHGPESSYGNVTWGEFIYADQCMINGMHQAALAALFRPERFGWDGETDRRIPFTVPGTKHRFHKFGNIDEALRMAIVWNYRAMRSASIEAAYPALYPYYDPSAKPEKDEDDESDQQEEQPTAFSWVNVHRDILGENIQDEERFLALPVHTVLYRLNAAVVESKNRKKSTT